MELSNLESSFWAVAPGVIGAVGLLFAAFFYFRVKALPDGDATMNRIAGYIREGAMAFLVREYKVLAVYCVVLAVIIGLTLGEMASASFVLGAFLSLLAGYIGMKAATFANVRTAQAARTGSKPNALLVALDGGAVMGLAVAGLGLIGMGGVYYAFQGHAQLSPILHAFAVGASSIALFARVGGGIYTKAADVGSDIAGKVIENIPEDDPRNPGVIADNVGDNVGDVAGMGADIYESMVAALVAAMAIALTANATELSRLVVDPSATGSAKVAGVVLPLVLSAVGLVVSIVSIFIARALKHMNPAQVLRSALIMPPVILVGLSFVMMELFGLSQNITVALAAGAFGGAIIGLVTDYYTSSTPVQRIAEASITGAGTNLIRGLAVGMESVGISMATIALVAYIADRALGLYGIALSAVGMLGGTAVVMTVDAYGPISDNAGGISEMSGLGPEVRAITDDGPNRVHQWRTRWATPRRPSARASPSARRRSPSSRSSRRSTSRSTTRASPPACRR